jgi:inosine-uridine nucleoside N-ribohydrolase
MTSTLFISDTYRTSPQVYKNFCKAVIEPALMDGHSKPVTGNELLKEYNACWDNKSKNIVFDTENDLTMFLLRFT